tara:strand:+ start:163 stop:654 length:492 start_codon:yes stop_codon:yes gene_type:complete
MKAYLSGPIENAENDGASWRQDITLWLKDNLNHEVFNPVSETKNIIGHLNPSIFRSMKKTDPIEYKNIIREIIKLDLEALINDSDYLIVKWDKSVLKGGGTHGEVTMAYWIKKPIFIVNSLPIDDMSSWIFSCSDFIFNDFQSLKKKLTQLYKGIPNTKRMIK